MPVTPRAAIGLVALLAVSLAACGGGQPAGDTAGVATCGRECLIEMADAYVAALVAGDPAAVPLAEDVAFVENVSRMRPGEGLWATASSGPAGFAIHVPDVVQQQAGFIGVLQRDGENGPEPVLLAFRLKLLDGEIVEAEHLVSGVNANNMQRLQTPRAGLTSEVPAGSR